MRNGQYPQGVAKASLAALVAGCGVAIAASTPAVPDNLQVSPNEALVLEAKAVGVQIYACLVRKDDATKYEWTFKAPEAELSDASGKKIGTHYAGPTWESSDGSKVVGEVKSSDKGPDVNAIPWLLLRVKSSSGNGVLSQTKSVQRLDTAGGKAPVEGCDATQAGKEARVGYTATYYFYAAK